MSIDVAFYGVRPAIQVSLADNETDSVAGVAKGIIQFSSNDIASLNMIYDYDASVRGFTAEKRHHEQTDAQDIGTIRKPLESKPYITVYY